MSEQNKKWLEDGKELSRNFPQGQGGKTGLYKMPENAQALQTDGQLRNGASWGTNKPQSAGNIRRLTPTECERLQGFPDGWTKDGLTKDGGQAAISDTQRYKCLGNAVTTNVVSAIGVAIIQHTDRDKLKDATGKEKRI